jgi:predicted Zn-dependent protease
MRRFVQDQPHYDHRDSPERMAQHALILAKIHAFMDPPGTTLRAYPESDTGFPARYARAIAFYRRFGMTGTGEDDENLYFTLHRDDFRRNRDDFMKILQDQAA